jgi:hypothetical protein
VRGDPRIDCNRLSAAIARRAQELTKAKLDAPATSQAEPLSQPPPAQPEAPTAPLPEAPVSITLKATLHGHEVLVTLRGTDFASVKAQVEQASAWLHAHRPAPAATEGWCPKHGVPMKQRKGKYGSFYSHMTADGWCNGK